MNPARDYLTALKGGLRVAAGAKGPQRWRRLVYVGVFMSVLPTIWVMASAGMLLDSLVYPAWRREPLEKPLFIVGNHRTGSTFLQRLLARDDETFAVYRLFELFLPAIVHKRMVRAAGRVDALVGRPLGRLVDWADDRWGNDYRKVHPMGIRLPEEDEYVLFFRLASAAMWETFPQEASFRRHFWQDTDMDPAEADRHMAFYREMAQRQRFHVGRGTWMSKNPLWSGRIKALRRAFPDARFVYLVRDPRKVVPSTASLLWAALDGVGAVGSKEELMPMVHEICTRFYSETLENLEGLPPEQLVVVRQEDLVADLDGTIGGMLAQLGLPYTDTLRAAVAEAAARGPTSKHKYALADWGLTEADIVERYGDVMARWGYGEPAVRGAAASAEATR